MGEVPHDCTICTVSEDHRRAWGCDAETDGPQEDMGHAPLEFHGKPLHRCPRALLRESGGDWLRPLNYFNAVYDAHGHLPSGGGFHDQPASWCSAAMLLQGEKNRIQRKQHERAAAQAKAK